jgi:hypothetical protein
MKLLFFLTLFINSRASEIQREVIYGTDDRNSIDDTNEKNFKLNSASIAMMVSNDKLIESVNGVLTKITGETLEKAFSLCPGQRFGNEISTGKCTGFLIGDDLLASAGHCVINDSACQENSWIFEFRDGLILHGQVPEDLYIPSKNIYRCKELVARESNPDLKIDYEIIRLDRPVLDRPVLKLSDKIKIEDNADLILVGHGLGLPQTISPGVKILSNENPNYFLVNSNSFSGNSGSPIFNKKTGEVEGILVRGEQDFEFDQEKNCNNVKICPEDGKGCSGEGVIRIFQVSEALKKLYEANGDKTLVKDNFNWKCFLYKKDC